jgi:hypothetical protein
MQAAVQRVTRGSFCALLGLSLSVMSTSASGGAGLLPRGWDDGAPQYQSADDWNGDASVVVDLGSRTTTNEIEINANGPTSRASGDVGGVSRGASASLADAAALAAISQAAVPGLQAAPIPINLPADAPIAALAVAPSLPIGAVSDGVAVDGIATGGQTGISVMIGDTAGGPGEPGAPGGDAHVAVRVGDVTGGTAVGGEATAGMAIDLVDPAAGAVIDIIADELLSETNQSGSARLGSLVALPLGPATGGSAIGGSARGGDATVDIRIGDTTGGAGVNGQPGGDAIVLIDIGSVAGGAAIGGDAVGGDALRGPGRATAGDAYGGAARGGDASVLIHVGDMTGVAGAGLAGDATVIVAVGSLTGGTARGGSAVSGDAWGLLGIDSRGGDAIGGEASGGNARLELRIDDMVGGSYRGEVGAIVGGDATGGTAVGGDSIDLELAGA